jgi:hypothetical protein
MAIVMSATDYESRQAVCRQHLPRMFSSIHLEGVAASPSGKGSKAVYKILVPGAGDFPGFAPLVDYLHAKMPDATLRFVINEPDEVDLVAFKNFNHALLAKSFVVCEYRCEPFQTTLAVNKQKFDLIFLEHPYIELFAMTGMTLLHSIGKVLGGGLFSWMNMLSLQQAYGMMWCCLKQGGHIVGVTHTKIEQYRLRQLLTVPEHMVVQHEKRSGGPHRLMIPSSGYDQQVVVSKSAASHSSHRQVQQHIRRSQVFFAAMLALACVCEFYVGRGEGAKPTSGVSNALSHAVLAGAMFAIAIISPYTTKSRVALTAAACLFGVNNHLTRNGAYDDAWSVVSGCVPGLN